MPLIEPMLICWVGRDAQKNQPADDLLIVVSAHGAEIGESILSPQKRHNSTLTFENIGCADKRNGITG